MVGWIGKDVRDDRDLPREDAESAAAPNGREGRGAHTLLSRDVETCVNLLAVTDVMLRVVTKIRHDTGVPLHARVGISVGTVVAGVQGELQPRFAVQVCISRSLLPYTRSLFAGVQGNLRPRFAVQVCQY